MTIQETLIIAPTVHVVGQTSFNTRGLDGWIEFNRHNEAETYITSPIKHIRDQDQLVSPEHDGGELMAEFAGRFCYDSFQKGRASDEYIGNILEMRHGSVLEHVTYNLAISGVSRSLTHELIRHRAGFAVSQESQRYVDAKSIKFVVPPICLDLCNGDLNDPMIQEFRDDCEKALGAYARLQARIAEKFALRGDEDASSIKLTTMQKKRAMEAARALLPNASETKLVWTGNLRALRHFCELRGSDHADLEIRRLAVAITEAMMDLAPFAFADSKIVAGDCGVAVTSFAHSKV